MANDTFRSRYGPCALIAGAAAGLGAAYARQIAAAGLDLILLDRDEAALKTTVAEIQASHRVRVEPLLADLASEDFVDRIRPSLAGREIGLLVCNAAIGTVAPFLDISSAQIDAMLDVNCRAPLLLVQGLAPAMVERGRGGIILMSSMSGDFGSSQLAVYAGTKAFTLVVGDALWAELGPRGIDVLVVRPGSTRTPGWLSTQRDGEEMPAMQPDEVVREALEALGREPNIIPGEMNRQAAAMLAGMPRRQVIEMMSGITARLLRNDKVR
jgi:short-subunit dehydrogenase